ncbi:hypothetical protein QJS66_05610 [Kocuria rhizophila]|nr:hypothetical protein QJS66_05610 [Kocuria rhizophila]
MVTCALALAAALADLPPNVQITQGTTKPYRADRAGAGAVAGDEALTQDIEANSAPQNLAARANDLGMVPAQDVGSINVDTGDVTPPSAPAEKDSQDILVPPAEMQGSDAAESNCAAAEERAEKRAKEEAEKKTASVRPTARPRRRGTSTAVPSPRRRSARPVNHPSVRPADRNQHRWRQPHHAGVQG